MSDTVPTGLPDAARRLGVTVRRLRQAIRTGAVPAPPHLTATSPLPPGWLDTAEAAMQTAPVRTVPQKVPPFARYEGTSAWRKYRVRAREYARFQARP